MFKGTGITAYGCLTSDTSQGLIFSQRILYCKAKFKQHMNLIALTVKPIDVCGNSDSSCYLPYVLYFYKIKVFYFCKLASVYLFLSVLERPVASPHVQMFVGPACGTETYLMNLIKKLRHVQDFQDHVEPPTVITVLHIYEVSYQKCPVYHKPKIVQDDLSYLHRNMSDAFK